MPFTPDQHREHRKKLRAKGICIMCRKNKAEEGMTRCVECGEYVRRVRAEWRGHKCGSCGAELMEHTVLTGQLTCCRCTELAMRRRNYR